jgi:hypothetical protein
MPDINRGELIALLKMQLTAAEERADRWRMLGQQLKHTNRDLWENIAKLRHAEVQQLRKLLQEAQAEDE